MISSLEGDVDRQYGNVDVAVVHKDDSTDNLSGNPGKDLKISGAQADRIVKGARGGPAARASCPPRSRSRPRAGHSSPKATTGRLSIDDAELNPARAGVWSRPVAGR